MTDARPFIAHDFSPHSGCCVLCGLPEAGAPPECVPTTAEPEIEVCAEDYDRITEWQQQPQKPTNAAVDANRLFHSLRREPRP